MAHNYSTSHLGSQLVISAHHSRSQLITDPGSTLIPRLLTGHILAIFCRRVVAARGEIYDLKTNELFSDLTGVREEPAVLKGAQSGTTSLNWKRLACSGFGAYCSEEAQRLYPYARYAYPYAQARSR